VQVPPARGDVPSGLPPLVMPPAPGERHDAPPHGAYQAAPPTYYAPPSAPTSTAAIVSLVCGILGLLFILPVIGPIAAVIAGHMARAEIRRSEGRLGGSGMATAGLIMGYLMIAFTVLATCAGIAFFVFIAAAASN
jgi:hypothetical protein